MYFTRLVSPRMLLHVSSAFFKSPSIHVFSRVRRIPDNVGCKKINWWIVMSWGHEVTPCCVWWEEIRTETHTFRSLLRRTRDTYSTHFILTPRTSDSLIWWRDRRRNGIYDLSSVMWVKLCEGSHVKADACDGSLRDDLQRGIDVTAAVTAAKVTVEEEKKEMCHMRRRTSLQLTTQHFMYTV